MITNPSELESKRKMLAHIAELSSTLEDYSSIISMTVKKNGLVQVHTVDNEDFNLPALHIFLALSHLGIQLDTLPPVEEFVEFITRYQKD